MIDPHSAAWREIEAAITAHLVVNRAELETPNLDPRRHDELVGAIQELKSLLHLREPPPPKLAGEVMV